MDSFGDHLRHWRALRRMSQLQLAMAADVSGRHVSFLESGRARPSRGMLLKLAEALTVPRDARNTMLEAAGFARLYTRSRLADDHMSAIRAAMQTLITGHDPCPALIMDKVWRIVDLNRSGQILFAQVGLSLGDSLLGVATQPDRAAAMIENWGEVGHHILHRLRAESRAAGGVHMLDQAARQLEKDPAIAAFVPGASLPPILSTIYRAGSLRLPLFSTFAQFSGAEDLALTDLKIELMFPADAAAAALLQTLA
ncbi:helix-turn-helix domain-containing protein [Actibacterium sp. 188UL27-1]|uniref:helix-turn-helix domain-containing protein n=1 Tax=Actibacterium sp. 188UL27-1 TaxID=2786961 RepID=UPI0019574074|nr:helix-turn-helix domain-containing protein [Actibacterium sp. 188UL27-1]MBM7067631.1 helix-turn-helix domain-containing protein [Actibacterium sp. 188UL27-1]